MILIGNGSLQFMGYLPFSVHDEWLTSNDVSSLISKYLSPEKTEQEEQHLNMKLILKMSSFHCSVNSWQYSICCIRGAKDVKSVLYIALKIRSLNPILLCCISFLACPLVGRVEAYCV